MVEILLVNKDKCVTTVFSMGIKHHSKTRNRDLVSQLLDNAYTF